MRISKKEIDDIKQSNDLVTIIQSKGIQLKKKGQSYVGLCPFHNEKTPSFIVDPMKQLWNCFGCPPDSKGSTGGDVIGFIAKYDNINFREAIEKLKTNTSSLNNTEIENLKLKKPTPKDQDTPPFNLIPKQQKLLNRVVELYHTTFIKNEQGLKYLIEKRKINDTSIFKYFKIGFANGSLLEIIPDKGKIIDSLKDLGILNDREHEHFFGSVIFPIYDLFGNIINIYGRKIKDQENNHLYLPGPRRGIFNWQAAKLYNEIILTESIIDSLSLFNAGFKNTIPCYGINGVISDHLTVLQKYKVKSVYLCFDGDDAGKKATKAIAPMLADLNIKVYPIMLPCGQDINSFFSLVANPKNEFKELMIKANLAIDTTTDKETIKKTAKKAAKEKKNSYQKGKYGFEVTLSGREYEIIGISRTPTKLKATVKGIKRDMGKKRFHVDTIDFYSSKSRTVFISALCDFLGETEDVISDDINRIMEHIEEYGQEAAEDKNGSEKKQMTETEQKEALDFLKNPNIFDEILADFETVGCTGDDTNKLLCYLAAISRKMEDPLSVMIQSRSAAGKSFLQDAVLAFMPDEDYVKYTRLTDQSLFYKGRDSLVHKILAIEELDGMDGAIYSIRSIQSSKKITIAYTGKDPVTGAMSTEENTVDGPIMVFITTTQVDIDGETASRFIFISLDESRQMTKRILEKQREKHTMEGLINKINSEQIIKKHRCANNLLKNLCVINPYSKLLTFTSKSLRARRDHMKYLNLILVIAFLFQYQREVKKMRLNGKEIEYITVELADIEKANEIANEVLGMSMEELSSPSKRLLQLIHEMIMAECRKKKINSKEYQFTRRQIREYTGWSDFQIRTHIKQLIDLEYIHMIKGKWGKEYIYEINYTPENKNSSLIGQIDIEELKEKAKKAKLSY
ncbi:MAG: toprim domain-containing protein [Spirochaetes bacterium]|nr:toprim domain-containing protein [Spirochaetota bacterium]